PPSAARADRRRPDPRHVRRGAPAAGQRAGRAARRHAVGRHARRGLAGPRRGRPDRFQPAARQRAAGGPGGAARPGLLPGRSALVSRLAGGGYRWRHEQVRQAVLGAVAGARAAELHLAAGRGLHRSAGEDRLFEAVEHLNAAVELLPTGDETRWLAELNLDAGRRAARVGAFPAAKEYLAMGLDLLDPRSWRRCPELAIELHLESARAEFASGNRER